MQRVWWGAHGVGYALLAMTETEHRPMRPGVKLAIELGPLVVFFVSQRRWDLIVATGAFMVAMVVSVAAARRLEGRWPTMPLITLVFVLVLGGLTLLFGDGLFIKIKPTFTNLTFAAILLGGMARGKLFLKVVFGEALQLQDEGWRKLTLRFGWFFVALAALNEVVWRNFSDDGWTNFKVFGIMPLTLVFMLLQGGLLQQYAVKPEGEKEG